MSILGRLAQGLSGLRPRLPEDRDAVLADMLTAEQRSAFLKLPTYDQRHLCAVFRDLRERGESNPDLLLAALLHDLGKAALGGRVTLVDRTANVLLGRFAQRWHERLTTLPAPRWRLGLALARHHPWLGAEWAARLGCSDRVCWLIAHHADEPPPDDPELHRLIAADRTN